MSENTTENNAEENSEVELLMMDQKSINSIIAVIQDSDLPLIKTCFNTVTVTTKSDGTEGHELRILIADYVSFNPCTPLANAWVADNILLFTVFDGVLENRYGLQEGASFRNHYDNIPEVTDLDKMSKFCYRVMKLIRNAIQHNLSAVHYTPPSGQNTASFGPYSINYIHRGTTFSLDIDNKAVQFLYTIVVNLVTNSINKMQLTQGHYEGILNAMFEQMKEGISSLSDDISVWSNTNTASTTTPTTVATSPASSTNVNNATSSPSQQSQQNQQSSQQTSTARYDSQHLRFYQRYVVENPVIIQDDVESAIAGSSGNSSFVIFKHIEENPTIDETSNQYWYSTDYRYKDYLLPQELGSITWGTGSDVISCREQAIIRFNKADITDRWKLR